MPAHAACCPPYRASLLGLFSYILTEILASPHCLSGFARAVVPFSRCALAKPFPIQAGQLDLTGQEHNRRRG